MLDVKEILARSVNQLLESRHDVSRLTLSRQMQVADGTLGRIKYGNGNPNVDTVQAIARFFRLQPWQLMVEDFNLASPPQLLSPNHTPEGLTDTERELVRVLRSLGEPERSYLLKQARSYMESVGGHQDIDNKSLAPQRSGTDDKPVDKGPLWGTW